MKILKIIKVLGKHCHVFLKINYLKLVNGNRFFIHYDPIYIGDQIYDGLETSYLPIYIDLNDKGLSRELAINHVHEAQSTDFLKTILKKDMIALDVGSNIGYFALLEARYVGNKGKVFAIEPSPRNSELLETSLQWSLFTNIKQYTNAIGSHNGIIDFIEAPQFNRSCVKELFDGQANSIKVKMVSIDSFVKTHRIKKLDLIRMDIEGYEWNALQGMKQTLKKLKPKWLFIEVHPLTLKENNLKFYKLLKQEGYIVKKAFFETDNMGIKGYWVKKLLQKMIANPLKAVSLFSNEVGGLKSDGVFDSFKALQESPQFSSKSAHCFFKRVKK